MGTMSAPQEHSGRRRGLKPTFPDGVSAEGDPAEPVVPSTIKVCQTTVIPKTEYERIRNNISTLDKEAIRICKEKEEKEALHERSQAIVKHWTNTIAGQRQVRLHAKLKREEIEEVEKQRLDLEEAEYRAGKRREAIEHAKTKLYFQNDKIKTFHGALVLTDALKERHAQIELKNKIAKARHTHDEDIMRRKIEAEIIKDEERLLKKKNESKKNADEVLQQIEHNKHELELLKLQDQREGEEIQRLTRLHELEMCKLKEMDKKAKENNRKSYQAYLEDRDFLKRVEKQKQEVEDEKIRCFILAKKKLAKLKMEKQLEMEREIQRHRDNISALLFAQYKQKLDTEDEIIAKAVELRDERECMEREEKADKLKAALESIEDHRLEQIQRKEEQEKEDKLKALKTQHILKEADDMYMEHTKLRNKKAEAECRKIQAIQVKQMADRRARSRNEKETELKYEKQSEAILALEEESFQRYAQHVIDSVRKSGGYPLPLIKVAQAGFGGGRGPVFADRGNVRPSYMVADKCGVQLPAYQNCTTQEIKGLYDPCDISRSKKKLGFTW